MMNFFIAMRYIRGKGSAVFSINARLSFIGVFAGTSLLVVVLSIFNGFQSQLYKSIGSFDPHLMLRKDTFAGNTGIEGWQIWKDKAKEVLRDSAISVEGMIESPAIMRRASQIEPVMLRGQEFNPVEEEKNGTKTIATDKVSIPAYFPEITNPEKMTQMPVYNSCLIGREMALLQGLKVGDYIELIVPRGQFSLRVGVTPNMRRYKIAGFFKTGHYQYDSKVVIIPLQSAQRLFATGEKMQQIAIRLNDLSEIKKAESEINKIWPYNIRTLQDEQRNFFAALKLEKTIMTTIVFLFVIAAMIGILVATFNVVRSRRRDIGILKAVGISDASILTIFTLNGFLMGTLGTVFGLMFGVFLSLNLESIIESIEAIINSFGVWYSKAAGDGFWMPVELIPRDVYYFDHLPIFIDPGFLHTLGTVSILLSGIAALIPAWYASRMQPIDIIRKAET